MMKHNPDNRSDNVEKIQRNINKTIQNMELAEEMIVKTDNAKMEQALEDKNDRRRDSLEGMRKEIKDEAIARKKE